MNDQIYAVDMDKQDGYNSNDTPPALIGYDTRKIDWNTESFVCWQPDELDNHEFNVIMYCPQRDIIFRGRSCHLNFIGKEERPAQKEDQKPKTKGECMDKSKVYDALIEYMETRISGCIESISNTISDSDCLDFCDKETIIEMNLLNTILKKAKQLAKDSEVTQ